MPKANAACDVTYEAVMVYILHYTPMEVFFLIRKYNFKQFFFSYTIILCQFTFAVSPLKKKNKKIKKNHM